MTDDHSKLISLLWDAHDKGGFHPRIFAEAATALHDLQIINKGLSDMIAQEVVNKIRAKLSKQLDDFENALQFYANPVNYSLIDQDSGLSIVLQDAGDIAREVLSQYPVDDKAEPPSSDPQKSSS